MADRYHRDDLLEERGARDRGWTKLWCKLVRDRQLLEGSRTCVCVCVCVCVTALLQRKENGKQNWIEQQVVSRETTEQPPSHVHASWVYIITVYETIPESSAFHSTCFAKTKAIRRNFPHKLQLPHVTRYNVQPFYCTDKTNFSLRYTPVINTAANTVMTHFNCNFMKLFSCYSELSCRRCYCHVYSFRCSCCGLGHRVDVWTDTAFNMRCPSSGLKTQTVLPQPHNECF
jgi:hypothetical protein